ncbi:redoxin domain-containing protein [Rhizobium halophilum]|uniref:redoxin domain-containing protein n=1 Tax=Rhizobium halophilum TaxID=2846852 RepID=UPI00374D67D1
MGQTAPDFTLVSTDGEIRFHDWLGSSWGVLFSHLSNFTPVCTAELGKVARLRGEWEQRNTKAMGCPWTRWSGTRSGRAMSVRYKGRGGIKHPLLSDPDRDVAALYGMIHPETNAMETVRKPDRNFHKGSTRRSRTSDTWHFSRNPAALFT